MGHESRNSEDIPVLRDLLREEVANITKRLSNSWQSLVAERPQDEYGAHEMEIQVMREAKVLIEDLYGMLERCRNATPLSERETTQEDIDAERYRWWRQCPTDRQHEILELAGEHPRRVRGVAARSDGAGFRVAAGAQLLQGLRRASGLESVGRISPPLPVVSICQIKSTKGAGVPRRREAHGGQGSVLLLLRPVRRRS